MISEITFLTRPGYRQDSLFGPAADALKRKGVKVAVRSYGSGTKAVAVWGWRKGAELRKQGHDVLVFERAYLGDRFSWTSIGWNGLNGYADFCLPKEITPERYEKNFFPLKPWKTDGDYIVIMGQVPGDMSLKGQDLTEFYEDAAAKLARIHKKKVYFRPHPDPKGRNFTPLIERIGGSLDDALAKALAVLTFNSNAGVDAVAAGIPAMSFDKGSMAYSVTSHFLDDIIYPERAAWANRLAHCQWTPDEIAAGDYWERISGYR